MRRARGFLDRLQDFNLVFVRQVAITGHLDTGIRILLNHSEYRVLKSCNRVRLLFLVFFGLLEEFLKKLNELSDIWDLLLKKILEQTSML